MIFVLDSFTRVINAATIFALYLLWHSVDCVGRKISLKSRFHFCPQLLNIKELQLDILAAESKILGGTSSHEAELFSHSQRFPYPLTPICNKNKIITTAINVFCLSYEIKWILYQPGSLNPKSRLIIMNMENINFSI